MARTIALEEHFTKELAAYAVGILSIACPECGRKRCDCRSTLRYPFAFLLDAQAASLSSRAEPSAAKLIAMRGRSGKNSEECRPARDRRDDAASQKTISRAWQSPLAGKDAQRNHRYDSPERSRPYACARTFHTRQGAGSGGPHRRSHHRDREHGNHMPRSGRFGLVKEETQDCFATGEDHEAKDRTPASRSASRIAWRRSRA